MATRSLICVNSKYIYVHLDGYPEYMGPILLEHYNVLELAQALVQQGDLRQIPREANPQNWEQYGSGPTRYNELQEIVEIGREVGAEHIYRWNGNRWEWLPLRFIPLTLQIAEAHRTATTRRPSPSLLPH